VFLYPHLLQPPENNDSPAHTTGRRLRRGATGMEYAVVASFILVAAAAGINYLSQSLKTSTQDTSDAISKALNSK
jgi:Flp pilus assembly pilin Flp